MNSYLESNDSNGLLQMLAVVHRNLARNTSLCLLILSELGVSCIGAARVPVDIASERTDNTFQLRHDGLQLFITSEIRLQLIPLS